MASALGFVWLLCLISGLLTGPNVSACPSCPAGWSQLDSRCFIIQKDQKSAVDAELTCIGLGGNLASVHNTKEHNFIRFLLESSGLKSNVWIGLNDGMQEKRWMWTDGSGVNFTSWSKGEPNNLGPEDCTEILTTGLWNDQSCSDKRAFVCSKKL